MKQFEQPRLLTMPSSTIREYVRQQLRDFAIRQQGREQERRRRRNGRRSPPAETQEPLFPADTPGEPMQVRFRAQFKGMRTGFKFPNAPVSTVEVFRKADRWYAREATSKNVFKFGDAVSHGAMKDVVAESFEEQVSKWEPYGIDGNQLAPDSYTEDPKGNFTEVELFHVSAFGAPPEKPNYFKTACGAVVFIKQIRNTRGMTPPTCKACRVEWEKVKPEDRLR